MTQTVVCTVCGTVVAVDGNLDGECPDCESQIIHGETFSVGDGGEDDCGDCFLFEDTRLD